MKKINGIELINEVKKLAYKEIDSEKGLIKYEYTSYSVESFEEIATVLGIDNTSFGVLEIQYLFDNEDKGEDIVRIALIKNENQLILKEGYKL